VYTLTGYRGAGERELMAEAALARPGPHRQAMTASVLRGLARFADLRGIPAGPEFLLDYDVIEAFCVTGLPGRASSTRGTYRSVLYRLAAGVHGEPGRRATPFAGARAPAPYSPAERAELAAIARGQRGPAKRASALAMLVFGAGAGLRPGELAALRGSDVTRRAGRAAVEVRGGPAPRTAPVTCRYAGPALQLARCAGDDYIFRPGPARRGYKNFVNDFARYLVCDPDAPALSMGRARSSFICDHLAAGTPVHELLAITGIIEAESLARYARHVPGISSSKAALRARWHAETRR
jgi:integrase